RNTVRAATFAPASTFCTIRPGPNPRRCASVRPATTVRATNDFDETTRGISGIGTVSHGVASAAAGANRPTYSASATALAAIAPEKPATNDVHPVRNAAIGPNASYKYTYSPPARGLSAASSAYAIAPANASAPPTTHTPI